MIAAGDRESMSEERAAPRRRSVAMRAIQRIAQRDVVGILCAVVVVAVTTHAARRKAGVDTARAMAFGTTASGVATGQREAGGVLVSSAAPPAGGVALGAVLTESSAAVMGIRRGIEVVAVTTDAHRGEPGEHSAGAVALRTATSGVSGGQREATGVIELPTLPSADGVAPRAVEREAELRVVGIGDRVVVVAMALRTFGRQAGEHPTRAVTLRTSSSRVAADQSEALRVIETTVFPRRRRMAAGAVEREAELGVIRVARAIVVAAVTRRAVGGKAAEGS